MGGKEQTDTLKTIRACDRRVVVLTGAARSGKTAVAIDLYEAYLDEPTRPACAIIVPNYLAVQSLRRKLLERAPGGVLVAPLVMTFASLAERIAQAAGRSHRRISPTRRRAILGGVIASLAERGELTVLASVADTPGLPAAVDRAIAELKQAAVEPDTLAAAVGGANGRHADLLSIYRAYQSRLLADELYDEEGRMWQARDELAALDSAPIAGLRAVVADGFTDFTPTQLAILRRLADHLERVVITLPHADEPQRRRLWRWTQRQLARIGDTFGDLAAHVALPARDDGPAGPLLGSLFATDTSPCAWPDGLACVEAADPESECRAIARWVKAHLAAGDRPDDLAVLVRRRSDLATRLRRVFREAGLPPPAAETPLLATPPAGALMAVVTMACGFESPDVLNVLTCSYLDPSSLGPFGAETLDAAQLAIRLENVLGGRDRYARAAERLAGRLAERGDDLSSLTSQEAYLLRLGPQVLTDAAALFEALFARVDPIAAGAAPDALVAACRDLIGTVLQGGRGIDADTDLAEDLRAWAALAAALDDLAAGARDDGTGRTMTAPMLRQQLAAALGETPAPSTASSAAVRVTDVLDGRCLRAAHVWLAGVNEGAFPLPAGEGALIGEADRRRWIRRHGLPLHARDDHAAREMLLFYLTCARADRTLTISYHASDADGGAAAASGFVEAIAAPVAPAERPVTALPLAEFAPPPERILSWRELRNAAVAADGDGAAWQPAIDRGLLAPLARPLWAAHRRWAAEPCDRYDGVLDDKVLLEELAATVPARCVLSVSRLNDYLSCPWAYFAQRHLRLDPLPEPTDDWMARSRGLLVHAILQRLMTTLTADGPVPVEALAEGEVLDALDVALAAEAARAGRAVRCRGLWESELRRLRRHLADYLAHQAAAALPAQHVGTRQEWAFGLEARGAGPVELDGPLGRVRLRGRIDRVDRIVSGGRTKALVIDYKTGSLPSPATDVQLPVYIRAAEQLGDLPVAGGAFHGIGPKPRQRYLAETTFERGKVKTHDDYAEQLAAAEKNIHAAIAGIAAGAFGLATDGKPCPATYCPYRRICGHSPVRLERKGAAGEGDDA